MNDGFLSGLLNSIGSGARSTMDAAEQDLGRIGEGRLPDHALQLLSQLLGAYQPATGLKPIAQTAQRVFRDPKIGWENINKQNIDPLMSLLMNGQAGGLKDILLQALRAQSK